MNCRYCFIDIKSNLKSHENSCRRLQEIKNDIIRLYTIENKSIKRISDFFKIGKCKVVNVLGENIRGVSESIKLGKSLHPLIGFKHSDESKEKMRIKRLKWMKDNPDKTAWRQSNLSYPEKIFLEKIIEYEFDKRYLIIREKSIHPYFIDFAFINEKIAVEVDGSQHLITEKSELDKKKDELLNKNGWRVFRVTATEVIINTESVFERLIEFIGGVSTYESFGIHHNSDIKNYCVCGVEICKVSNMCSKCYGLKLSRRKVERPILEDLISDVNLLGYSGTGRKYGVSDNSIRKWIKYK